MSTSLTFSRASLRPAALLLLTGQILYVVFTLLHAGGDANDHHAVFQTYADDHAWGTVHVGQFGAMAVLLAGLVVLFLDLDAGESSRIGTVGISAAIAAFALYGALQAVDGIALKRAVNAWAYAAEAERTARFASAEVVRWLEWGLRAYHDFAFGLALLVGAIAVSKELPRLLALVVAMSGIANLAQGWLLDQQGFSAEHSSAIVTAWALNVAWMGWLAAIAFARAGQEQ